MFINFGIDLDIGNMTSKEKAFQMCNKYDDIVGYNSRLCALIAVDEIISIKLLWFQKNTEELDYWQEVKREIEKLCE